MKNKQIKLNEDGLRDFISYSVARLLKEAYGGSFDDHGNMSYMDSEYGDDSKEIAFNPWEDDDQMAAFQQAVEEKGLDMEMFDDGGDFGDIWPVAVKVNYSKSQGMKGGYDTPDDPDEIEVTGWDAGIYDLPPVVSDVMETALNIYFNDGYFDPDEMIAGLNEGWDTSFSERAMKYGEKDSDDKNKGAKIHFNGSGFKPKNPYEHMTWDEYKDAKKAEHDKEKKDFYSDEENKGTKAHFPDKKVHTSVDEIRSMIQKAINEAHRDYVGSGIYDYQGTGTKDSEDRMETIRQKSRAYSPYGLTPPFTNPGKREKIPWNSKNDDSQTTAKKKFGGKDAKSGGEILSPIYKYIFELEKKDKKQENEPLQALISSLEKVCTEWSYKYSNWAKDMKF